MTFKHGSEEAKGRVTLVLVTVLFLFAILSVILGLYVDLNIDENSLLYKVLNQMYRIRFLLGPIILTMAFLVILMYTDEFDRVRNKTATKMDLILFTMFFTCMAIGLAYDELDDETYVKLSGLAIMFAAFTGYRFMPILSSLIASFTTFIGLYNDSFNASVSIAALLIVTGVIMVFVCDGKLTRTKMYISALILIVFSVISTILVFYYEMYGNKADVIIDMFVSIVIIVVAVLIYEKNLSIVDSLVIGEKNKEELSIAHNIQANAIPRNFDCGRLLEYHGFMESAIEMSGDFFDSFEVKNNLRAIVVADVSEKGLPAALFMMKAKSVIKSIAVVENNPEKILSAANNELCDGNEAEQFVTAWIGIIDADTGMLYFSDAGHPVPYLKRKNGRFEKIKEKKGLVLGSMEDVQYKRNEIKLEDGDTMFIYTDGVNEAMSSSDEQYGYERLSSILNGTEGSCKDIIVSVRNDIRRFTGDIAMSDDITMFCLRVAREGIGEITVPAKNENLERINDFIEECLTKEGCPIKDANKMEVVAEEIFVNICDYAYVNVEGDVTVFCSFFDNEMSLTFMDSGVKFDPVQRSEIVIGKNVEDWSIGGFGIHMVRKMVDSMEYRRICDRNVFTVRRKLDHHDSS